MLLSSVIFMQLNTKKSCLTIFVEICSSEPPVRWHLCSKQYLAHLIAHNHKNYQRIKKRRIAKTICTILLLLIDY